jgi:hypothetical protein
MVAAGIILVLLAPFWIELNYPNNFGSAISNKILDEKSNAGFKQVWQLRSKTASKHTFQKKQLLIISIHYAPSNRF